MAKKNTGLGSSLLLQPTERPAPHAADELAAADVHAPERSERLSDQDVPPASRQQRQLMRLRDRCTIYLDEDVNQQLDIAARIQKKQRSEVVTEILRQYLPRYRIDVDEPGEQAA